MLADDLFKKNDTYFLVKLIYFSLNIKIYFKKMCSDGDYDKYDGFELLSIKSFDSNTDNKTKYAFKHLLLKRKADRKKKRHSPKKSKTF